ncbi:MAG: hypothetical protein JRI66_12295 [Deltaproteobacteria bacterium]|nr:hypothetical protein [Deltaproteobacteria bacterium]
MDFNIRLFLNRAKRLLDECTVGRTQSYPGDLDIGPGQAVEMAGLLEEVVEWLENKKVGKEG